MLRTCILIAFLGLATPAAGQRYVVSVLPLHGIVSELAPDAEILTLVGPGQSPALYEPTPRQLAEMARADAVFVVGVPFERLMIPRARAQFPSLRFVDVAEGIERRTLPPMAAGAHDDHDHDGENDPHVWLGPVELRRIVENVAAVLEQGRPGASAEIRARRDAFLARIADLDAELAVRLAPLRGRAVLAYHPAFGYFTSRYGMVQLAVESEGNEPSARHLVGLAERVREENVTLLLVQPQFSMPRARTLARTLGIDVLEIDPLGEDVLTTLRTLANALVHALDEDAVGKPR